MAMNNDVAAEKLGQAALLVELGEERMGVSDESPEQFQRARDLIGEVQAWLREPPKPRAPRATRG